MKRLSDRQLEIILSEVPYLIMIYSVELEKWFPIDFKRIDLTAIEDEKLWINIHTEREIIPLQLPIEKVRYKEELKLVEIPKVIAIEYP